jgi:hypothetical protein
MEVAMINDVVLEGIIVKTWKYADDLLFRLACYRDPDLPQKTVVELQICHEFLLSVLTKPLPILHFQGIMQ